MDVSHADYPVTEQDLGLEPAMHATIGVGSLPAVHHQAEFAAACAGTKANKAIHDGATAPAWPAVDVAEKGN